MRHLPIIIQFIYRSICSGLFVVLTACASVTERQGTTFEQSLIGSSVTVIDFETSSEGLIVFELELKATGRGKFILDTGATTSALYAQTLIENNLVGKTGLNVRVHGMQRSETRPSILLEGFLIGKLLVEDIRVAILERPHYDEALLSQTKGIIGLDILSRYRIVIDSKRNQLFLISPSAPSIVFDNDWVSVTLTEFPFERYVYGLHFLKLRVNGVRAYAMLDTGSEFNVMNWNFKHLWQLKLRRILLREAWEHSGALGEFDPQGSAVLEGITSSGFKWPAQAFSVFDLNTFDKIGLKDQPVMIAGMPFLRDKTILIDFANDVMWMRVALEAKKSGNINAG